MATTDEDVKALTDAVNRTSTDVARVLDRLKASGLNPAQQALVQQATAALNAQDDVMEGVLSGGGGTPTPAPAGGPTP